MLATRQPGSMGTCLRRSICISINAPNHPADKPKTKALRAQQTGVNVLNENNATWEQNQLLFGCQNLNAARVVGLSMTTVRAHVEIVKKISSHMNVASNHVVVAQEISNMMRIITIRVMAVNVATIFRIPEYFTNAMDQRMRVEHHYCILWCRDGVVFPNEMNA